MSRAMTIADWPTTCAGLVDLLVRSIGVHRREKRYDQADELRGKLIEWGYTVQCGKDYVKAERGYTEPDQDIWPHAVTWEQQ